MDHIPHGQLGDLAADCPGNIGNLNDLPGNVMRAGILPDPTLDPGDEVFGEPGSVPEPDEENDPDVGLPVLSNYKALNDFRQLLPQTVDLGRADPPPAWIERRIASTQDNQSVMAGEPSPIAVAPGVGILAKVGGLVLGPVRIVPKADGHAGKRTSAN